MKYFYTSHARIPVFSIKVITSLSMILVVVPAFSLTTPLPTHAAKVPKMAPHFYQFPTRKGQTTSSSLPHWSSSFTSQGKTYPYTMVGTNPMQNGAGTTIIPVTIVPIKLTFSNNVSLDGTQKVQNTTASPLFQPASFTSGITQYGDAMQRAEFWNSVSKISPTYHVLLGTPTVLPASNITIPAADGQTTTASNGKAMGLVDLHYFDAQIQTLSTAHHFTSDMLPIFLTNNTFLYDGNANTCCILGYHNAVNTASGIQTYVWSSNSDAGTIHTEDISALSHEVAEWLNNPFLTNSVPHWSVAAQSPSGCYNTLEVGDPLIGVTWNVTLGGVTYHPQDEVFLSWFARLSPSRSMSQHYTYRGTFKTPSSPCITEYPIPTSNSNPVDIVAGLDGNLWFTEYGGSKIGKITPSGSITEYQIPTRNSSPWDIAAGPDGNLWFTEFSNKIGKITPSNGKITEYQIPTKNSIPNGITAGPDGNLWFTEWLGNEIGRITTGGSVMEFPISTSTSEPTDITAGQDGNLWFTEYGGNKIGKITPSGIITAEYSTPTSNSAPINITAKPDGNLWFTEWFGNKIGKITPSGSITEYSIPTSNSGPEGITTGLDGNLWFTEDRNKIGKITSTGSITEYPLPTTYSYPSSITAGPDGNLWFTGYGGNQIGTIVLN